MAVDVGSTDLLHSAWQSRPGLVGWLTAVNHKQVGKRFLLTALVFFLIGGVQALLMRVQLGTPDNTFLSAETYNALFTMHGTTMMFLFAVPMVEAFAVYFVPLMIGARDMPFPRLSAFGYWTYLFGGLFLYSSFLSGAVPDGGWFAYPPLTAGEFSPGPDIDYWLLGVTFVEISGIVAALELVVLIFRGRAPGMAISRMPLFVWAVLTMALMILFAFPPLVAGSTLLELQRKFGMGFFDPAVGGDPLLWQHLFWWFGHPEVYIMLLPAVGIVSTIVPTAARRPIVGYTILAAATMAIGIVSFGLWVHHMFTTGIPLLPASLFTAGSLLITIPSGVQVFGWIATLWRADVVWSTALLYAVGFIVLFVFGGLSGVMVASVPFDRQVHDTYFVVAHFHYVLIGGVVFPLLAAVYHWLPKVTGRLLHEGFGRLSFWTAFIGFNLTFFPQHIVGLLGMPRRVYVWPAGLGWELYNLLSTIGAFVLAAGFLTTVANIAWSLARGAPAGRDPWGAATLEWSIPSPPPPYNFATVPRVHGRDPLWQPAQVGAEEPWQRALAQPEEPMRVITATTVVDGDLDGTPTLPQRSWWPLLLALSLVAALLGLMVSRLDLGLIGVMGATISLVSWLWTREDEPA